MNLIKRLAKRAAKYAAEHWREALAAWEAWQRQRAERKRDEMGDPPDAR